MFGAEIILVRGDEVDPMIVASDRTYPAECFQPKICPIQRCHPGLGIGEPT
jgi:hypothetical protein